MASAHDPDCDFWFDHYDFECTCRAFASRPGMEPPAADPARNLGAIRAEIAELRRQIEQIEACIDRTKPSGQLPCPLRSNKRHRWR
jgi:hypothetical protein